jgi:hypothetical protein
VSWLLLGSNIILAGYRAWLLLIAYRVIGKPPGADEKYDAWHRQWDGSLKFLGWAWIVVTAFCLIGAVLWWSRS